ncbi:hypothetical protein [Robbsia andropogonis]|uniref:hypothetical protein n=1 Tax=Robbsia andropogonis TaxID=28092 RepID=UPI00209FB337|nr:hypothetical protein [Robbsia andropogonis]MCP1121586.1 hypothetical protein [Robbsia andropogonis]MCP1131406.1 hypothetical protein [Robbsia andropogonis]
MTEQEAYEYGVLHGMQLICDYVAGPLVDDEVQSGKGRVQYTVWIASNCRKQALGIMKNFAEGKEKRSGLEKSE